MIDEDKLERLMQQYTKELLRVSYYYTHNMHTAQDIVQEVYIRFYHKQIALFDEEMKPYLLRMVINQSKDYLKSWHYRKMKIVEKMFSQSSNDTNHLIQKEEEDEISEAIFSLPLKQRETITYYYFEGYTTREISYLLKVPESTIKSRLNKARERLREQLKNADWEALLNG
ncbi:sigma-70 family RNA polymerase sigma factor [Psychrobacillus sp. INOP01]|uniref:sigma-70 family RNA polymerase sigma factor n=1 Tax=Psychrobacillus sp. INOP01 TaxID=2829187 RepID=UPI001BAB40BB|nr:sigma-70 family RNA polymerase sigma factor [Psychrobacillus sp. INOP01]QUG41180.1 sigma-70 family RNA polymerase sigma factor [Psychrobacillus sp. INOP01]